MTPWLRKSLSIWLAGSALIVTAGVTQFPQLLTRASAQSKPEVPQTPEKLVQVLSNLFATYGELNLGPNYQRSTDAYLREAFPAHLISSNDRKLLGTDGVVSLLNAMSQIWLVPQFSVTRRETSSESRVIVEVKPDATQWHPRPFECVKEADGWKVDLLETYFKWAEVPESQRATQILKLTNAVMPGPKDPRATLQSCQSNLKQITLAVKQYTQDYDERMPLARTWQESLWPYTRSKTLFNCPEVTPPVVGGFAYNNKCSAKEEFTFDESASTVLLYESSHYKPNAQGAGELRVNRHLVDGQLGSNFGFIDGHVKWYAADVKPTFLAKPNKADLTYPLR